jgi:pescadillo protein
LQKIARKKFASSESVGEQKSGKYQISEEFKQTPEMQLLNQKEEQMKRQRELFNKCTFLLNRETPIYILQYLILSFGGSYATEEDVEYLKTHKITHHVIDRPLTGIKLDSTKEYVQPQWIADSLNNLFLLPTQAYRPGQAPPPHLSPFVDNTKEGYVPTRQKEINQLKGEIVDSDGEEQIEDAPEEPV